MAEKIHIVENQNKNFSILNDTQLNGYYYVLETQKKILEDSFENQKKLVYEEVKRIKEQEGDSIDAENALYGNAFGDMVVPVLCELDESDKIPLFSEFNLAVHGNEYAVDITAAEVSRTIDLLKVRMAEIEPHLNNYEKYKDERDKIVEDRIRSMAQVYGQTQSIVEFSTDPRIIAEANNAISEELNGHESKIMTYHSKTASVINAGIAQVGEGIRSTINYGIKKQNEAIQLTINGTNLLGEKVDETIEVSKYNLQKILDMSARAGRSLGSIVSDIANYGHEVATKINDALYQGFKENLIVAMSFNPKLVNFAEKYFGEDEAVQMYSNAAALKSEREQKAEARNEKLEAIFKNAENVMRTPFNVAVGITAILNEEMGLSKSMAKAVAYAKSAYEISKSNIGRSKEWIAEKFDNVIKAIDLEIDSTINNIYRIGNSFKDGLNKVTNIVNNVIEKTVDRIKNVPSEARNIAIAFIGSVALGGKAFIDGLKNLNDIGKTFAEATYTNESRVLAASLIQLQEAIGGTENVVSSKKYSSEMFKAILDLAKVLKEDPNIAVNELKRIYKDIASVDEFSFEKNYGKKFEAVLNAARLCGSDIPKSFKEFANLERTPSVSPEQTKDNVNEDKQREQNKDKIINEINR